MQLGKLTWNFARVSFVRIVSNVCSAVTATNIARLGAAATMASFPLCFYLSKRWAPDTSTDEGYQLRHSFFAVQLGLALPLMGLFVTAPLAFRVHPYLGVLPIACVAVGLWGGLSHRKKSPYTTLLIWSMVVGVVGSIAILTKEAARLVSRYGRLASVASGTVGLGVQLVMIGIWWEATPKKK